MRPEKNAVLLVLALLGCGEGAVTEPGLDTVGFGKGWGSGAGEDAWVEEDFGTGSPADEVYNWNKEPEVISWEPDGWDPDAGVWEGDGASAETGYDVAGFGDPIPGDFGAPCASDGDCLDEFCVEAGKGTVCSMMCVEECPDGFSCQKRLGQESLTLYCIPDFVPFCRPCSDAKDCARYPGDGAVLCREVSPDEGSFCTISCTGDSDCGEGLFCDMSSTCAPADACDCLQFGDNVGFETSCSVSNDLGTCHGTRKCSQEGMTACDAPSPSEETCDGNDNDCDGQIDQGIQSESCQITNEYGSCPGMSACKDAATVCEGDAPAPEACNGQDDDCDGQTDEQDAYGCTTYFVDADGDGYGGPQEMCLCAKNLGSAQGAALVDNSLDCDDGDPSVHPLALEVCDGKDSDCDSAVDQGCDDDGDGWCFPAPVPGTAPSVVCKHAEQDCDDSNKVTYPGAKELCDGKDNDCAGDVDEECDLDGDGYCNQTPLVSGPQYMCKKQQMDCDDGSAAVNPGAKEICNGKEDNCDNQLDPGCDDDKDGWCEGPVPLSIVGCVSGSGAPLPSCPELVKACPNGFDDCNDLSVGVHPKAVEACDGKDNDCDGKIDQGLDEDEDGYCKPGTLVLSGCLLCPPVPTDCFDSSWTVSPGAADEPDLLGLDSNCDGMDGDPETTIFVDGKNGADSSPGTINKPLKTIQIGIDMAKDDPFRKVVMVATGTYNESLELKNGVQVWGGFDPKDGWNPTTAKSTIIMGDTTAVTGDNLTIKTVLARMEVYAADANGAGESSVGIHASDSNGLNIIAVKAFAGHGGTGASAYKSADGKAGGSGANAEDGCWQNDDLVEECDAGEDTNCPNHAPAGSGYGKYTPGGEGDGVGETLTEGEWNPGNKEWWEAHKNLVAEPSACWKMFGDAKGGAGGVHIDVDASDATDGGDGVPGKDGAAGIGGSGYGFVTEWGYLGPKGTDGSDGENGCGGGGGGMGDNNWVDEGCGWVPFVGWICTYECDVKGGGGGGGGAGGMGGLGGKQGGGGGGSIGILLYKSKAFIQGCTLTTGQGGKGGKGGDPGAGGKGGKGGLGGPGIDGSGNGGDGGDGKVGGTGGPGGGGAGGPSYGIAYSIGWKPQQDKNTFFIGMQGQGGSGGATAYLGPIPNKPAGGWDDIHGHLGKKAEVAPLDSK